MASRDRAGVAAGPGHRGRRYLVPAQPGPGHANALRRWLGRHGYRRSRFFDDDGWYVNAWLRAYDVTGEAAFLDAARAGFADLLPAWDGICGGGVWWSHERTYKNAITNELFLLAAARLANRVPGQGYAGLGRSGLVVVRPQWTDQCGRTGQ